MPAHNRIGLNDMQHVSPPRPESRYKQPEEPIPAAQLRPGMGLLEHSDLLAQSQVLEREISATPKDGSERTDEDFKRLEHSQKANGAHRKMAIESSWVNIW
jgi:hypothetical protein